jgi:hypothetical protein
MRANAEEAANILSPHIGKIAAIAVATSSARTDLAAAAQLGAEHGNGYLTFVADGGKVWFFLNNADAGTADEAAVTGNDRTFVIPDGGRMDFKLRNGYTWLVHKGSAACVLRVYRSSSLGPGTAG